MAKFIPGLQLCELFYQEIVKPLLEKDFPKLKYAAGLIDSGSEVLGFDTERSTDHHWGPRLLIFLEKKDFKQKKAITEVFSKKLPPQFKGYSTHFGNPDEIGVQLLTQAKKGQPINHRIEVHTIETFFKSYLHLQNPLTLSATDWLTLPEQKLRTIRSGKIFHDGIGLQKIRDHLHYYPHDVWLYLMAAEWMKISQEEPFMARTGDVGDELGSKVIAARLVHTLMRLCFLMEREYAPYSKWFGTGFSRLKCAKKLSPVLNEVLQADSWKKREKYLSQAYNLVAENHNKLGLTKALPTTVSPFYDRPYLVIHADNFAHELKLKIKNPVIKKIPADIGSVNQFSSSADLLENDILLQKLKMLYK